MSLSNNPTIGFIGVGLMGHGMAKNIVTKGYPLVVMGHKNRAPVEHLVSLGAREARSARELTQACDIVHLCVTGSTQVEALLRGPDGVMASGKAGLIVIDCSPSNPVSTLALGEELKAKGMVLVDVDGVLVRGAHRAGHMGFDVDRVHVAVLVERERVPADGRRAVAEREVVPEGLVVEGDVHGCS